MDNRNFDKDPSYEQDHIENEHKNIDEAELDRLFAEETASEFVDEEVRPEVRNDTEIQSMYGWIAIALSVLSFFWIPLLFAGAGIILGFMARNRDAAILGNTAIVIGILSILIRLFILPLI